MKRISWKEWLNGQYREIIHVKISSKNKQVVEATTGWYESE